MFPPRKFANEKVIIGPINSNNPNVRQFVHPNHPWNNWVKLNLSNHPKNFLPTQTIKDNLQNIEKLKDCVACLLICYKDETHTFATAFRVAPKTFVSAKHHLLPSETLIPSSVQSIFLANVPAVPYYDRDVDLDNYKFIKAEVISLNDEERTTLIKEGKDPHKCTIKDIDPISLMEKDLIGDFLIIKSVEDVGDENAYLTPYYDEIKDDSQVAVLGYNLPVFQDYLDQMYDQAEDFVIDQHKIQRVFLGYNWKSLSPGFVAKSNDRLLAHTCSTTPGSSGAACVLIDNFTNGKMYFIGIHIGSWTKTQTKSNNYNMATSVRHPLFVEQYKKFVESEFNK